MKIHRYTAITAVLFVLACTTTPVLASKDADDDIHRVVIQVNANDPALMTLALNNASNINKYYMNEGEEVEIELVTYGPGLNMLRADSSPVKDRIASLAQNFDNIHYKACENTMHNMERKSGKPVVLVEQAEPVPSGTIHIMHRQEQGWSYIKP